MPSILNDFAAAVARHPDRVAIVDGAGREITFAQLQTRAMGFAQAWRARGIRQGDRVLLAMRLDADLYAALAGLWVIGATVVLPEPAMGLAGLRHAARVTGVTAICTSGMYCALKYAVPAFWPLKHLRPHDGVGHFVPATVADSDIALISFTSGTTGAPKAIPRSHAFLSAQHQAIAPLLLSDGVERDLVAFPVFVLINIASGQTSVLPSWKMSRLAGLSPDTLAQWVAQQGVTRALIPPALCEKLAQAKVPASLHTVFTGGGPVFPDMLAALQAARRGLNLVCVYGSTEAEPIAHLDGARIAVADTARMLAGDGLLVGNPVSDVQVRIVGDEIQVAGPHVNAGYLDPGQDAGNKVREGDVIWHRTGDVGRFDDAGRLWLLGRIGTQVRLAGTDVFPFSIEVAVRSWTGVRQCAFVAGDAGAVLVIEGTAAHAPEWARKARVMGIETVLPLAKIPMDRRHASKIDRVALARLIIA